jgi:hypothetical protein
MSARTVGDGSTGFCSSSSDVSSDSPLSRPKGTQFERLPSSIRDGASFSCTNTQDCKWYPLLPKDWSLTVLPFQSLCRPIIMMFKETIIFCMSIYLSFIYSLLYLLFFAFPIAFEEVRGWNPGTTGTAFVAVMVSCPCPNSCV